MTALTDTNFDQRQNLRETIAKFKFASHAAIENLTTFTYTEKFYINGVVKAIKTNAKNLTTDTTFTVTILDKDVCTIYTSGTINDNAFVYTKIALDSQPVLCGTDGVYYQVKITYSTGQDLTENEFGQVVLFVANQ
jgi:hypothetical protein